MESLPKIRQIKVEDLEVLNKVAEADGHLVVGATHVIDKNKYLVGYVGFIPAITIWLDTQRVKGRDSAMVMNFVENRLVDQGYGTIMVPCAKKSPLRPYLPLIGHVSMGDSELFFKNLKA